MENEETKNYSGMRFCNICYNLLQPTDEGQKEFLIFRCRQCLPKVQVKLNDQDDFRIKQSKLITGTQSDIFDKDMALDPTMPREKITCPQCGYHEAVYYLKTDKEEWSIIIVYICARLNKQCGYKWEKNKEKMQ